MKINQITWLLTLFFLSEHKEMGDAAVAAPADKKGPPKFKQRAARTFKSKAPKPGQKGYVQDMNISSNQRRSSETLPGN